MNFETLLKRVVFRMLTLILNSRKYFQNTNYTRDDKDLLLHTVVGHIFNQNCRKVNPFCGLPAAFTHHQGKLKYRLGFRNVQIPFLWSRFYEAFSRIIRNIYIFEGCLKKFKARNSIAPLTKFVFFLMMFYIYIKHEGLHMVTKV